MSIIEEKIDRLENHFSVYKKDMIDVKDGIKDIKTCLVGNGLNGEMGIVHLLKDLKVRVEDLERKETRKEVYINQLKVVVILLVTLVIGTIYKSILQ